MKMKALSLVLGAALGATAMQVSADGLLAPYFKQGPGGVTTLYALRTTGNGIANAQWNPFTAGAIHDLHFWWFYKPDISATRFGWENQSTPCPKDDAYGKASSYDMVWGDLATGNIFAGPPISDQSDPPTFGISNVEGFMIIAEEANGQPIGPEGGLSGFAYVVNYSAASAIDYKMLNNAADATGLDWTDASIAKTQFTMSWWPTGVMDTAWPTIVLGNNMLDDAKSSWAGAVNLQGDPNGKPPGQVYNNDEKPFSSQQKKPIVCAGWVTRPEIMTANAELNTRNGGWGPYVAVPANDNFCTPALDPNCKISATGALMQKFEYFLPKGPVNWTIEVSGGATPDSPY